MFVVANENFISIFVRAFRKSDAPGHRIGKSGCRLTGELSCNHEPNSTLLACHCCASVDATFENLYFTR